MQAVDPDGEQRPLDDEALRSVLTGGVLPADYPGVRSTSDGLRWIATPGLLLAAGGAAGSRWEVLQHVPELIRVHPVGAAIAVGGDPDRVPYRSRDGGRTWLPVAVPPGESVRDLAFDAATGRLWLLTGAALLRMAAATGAIEEVRRWPAETGYERLGLSADGQAIWLLTPGAGMLRLSRDGGVTWRDVALASTGTPEPALVDVACGGDRGSCLALLEDGRLLSLADGAAAANGDAGRLCHQGPSTYA